MRYNLVIKFTTEFTGFLQYVHLKSATINWYHDARILLGNFTLYIVIISTIFYSLDLSQCWGNSRVGKNINTGPFHYTKFLSRTAILGHDVTSLCNWFPFFQDNSLFSSSGTQIFCTFLPLHYLGNAGNQLVSKTHHTPEGRVPQLQCCKNPKLAKSAFLYCCRPLCFMLCCTFGSMILCWFSETMTSSISLRIRWSWGLMWNVSEIETFYISNSQGWNTKSLNTAVKGQHSCFLF